MLGNKDTRKRFLQRIRVPLGFVMAVVLVILARPTLSSILLGGAIVFLGVLIRAWAAGHIHKFEKLAVTGPYSHSRNPLYFGSLLLAGGFAVAGGIWWLALIIVAAYLGIYLPVMRVEEGDLRSRFGEEFERYAANVPQLFPRLTTWKNESAEFDFQLYLKHREYQAAIGAALAIGVLVVKMLLFSK